MSITALVMVTDALRLANIIDEVQSPGPEMGQKALRSLNQMMTDWEKDGIRLGWHLVDLLDSVLPLDESDERGIKYNLAVELCGEYGIEPSGAVAKIQSETYARLAKTSADEVVADLSGLPGEDANYYMSWPM